MQHRLDLNVAPAPSVSPNPSRRSDATMRRLLIAASMTLAVAVGIPTQASAQDGPGHPGQCGPAANVIVGGAGNDVLFGGPMNDDISGRTGNDLLYGLDGDDILHGNQGDDKLYGGRGDDCLQGGAGWDVCDGGPGFDTADATCEVLINIP
jgi:hypothetical protein